MLRLLLVRHGETEWNKLLRYQGHTQTPLSEAGRQQAKALSKRLAKEKIDAFYSSDLKRAMETAEIIAAPHQMNVTGRPEFREIKFGAWEGLTYKEIIEKYPQEMGEWQVRPSVTRIPEGEILTEVNERAMAGIEQIKKDHSDQTILLVAHGGVTRVILCSILGISLDAIWKIKQDNTALNIIEFYDDKAILCLLNDANHIRSGVSTGKTILDQ